MRAPTLPAVVWRWHLDVLFERLEEKAILVHLHTNRIFELNGTATRLWELLEAGADAGELLSRMTSEFEVDGGQLASEIDAVLELLAQEGLITHDR